MDVQDAGRAADFRCALAANGSRLLLHRLVDMAKTAAQLATPAAALTRQDCLNFPRRRK